MTGYTMYRRMVSVMVQGMSSLEENTTAKAVLVRIDNARQIGFATCTMENGDLAALVRGAPSTMSGVFYFMPRDRVRNSSLPINDAMAVLRFIGVGSVERLVGRFRVTLPQPQYHVN